MPLVWKDQTPFSWSGAWSATAHPEPKSQRPLIRDLTDMELDSCRRIRRPRRARSWRSSTTGSMSAHLTDCSVCHRLKTLTDGEQIPRAARRAISGPQLLAQPGRARRQHVGISRVPGAGVSRRRGGMVGGGCGWQPDGAAALHHAGGCFPGASLALAGMHRLLAAARRRRLCPYVQQPEQFRARPAALLRHRDAAQRLRGRGILVKTEMGRPIKIEGNPEPIPDSLGATDAITQAAVLVALGSRTAPMRSVSCNGQISTLEPAFQSGAARGAEDG